MQTSALVSTHHGVLVRLPMSKRAGEKTPLAERHWKPGGKVDGVVPDVQTRFSGAALFESDSGSDIDFTIPLLGPAAVMLRLAALDTASDDADSVSAEVANVAPVAIGSRVAGVNEAVTPRGRFGIVRVTEPGTP